MGGGAAAACSVTGASWAAPSEVRGAHGAQRFARSDPPIPAMASSIACNLPYLDQLDQSKLEMQTRLQRRLERFEQIESDLQIPGQILFAEACGYLEHGLLFTTEAAISFVGFFAIFATSRFRQYRANSRQKCCRLWPLRSSSCTMSSIRCAILIANRVRYRFQRFGCEHSK